MRVNVGPNGEESWGGIDSDNDLRPTISGNGRYVAFCTEDDSITPGDNNMVYDLIIHDMLTGTNRQVGSDYGGVGHVTGKGSFSADGRYFAFTAWENFLPDDTNGRWDLFVSDIFTGQITRVDVDSNGNQQVDGNTFDPSISADGRYVAFSSTSTSLVANDTNAQSDIFVHDLLAGTTTRISTDSSGTQASGGESASPSISADGRYIAFKSAATNLVEGDTNTKTDVFVRDMIKGTTTRVNTDSNGIQANIGSAHVSLSADGRYVAFSSGATNLVADDTNAKSDIFVHDMLTGTTTRQGLSYDGNQSNQANSYLSLSADGRYIAFRSSATNLVENDSNGVADYFITANTQAFTRNVKMLYGMSVASQDSAKYAQAYIDERMDELSQLSAIIGSSAARLQVAISNLSIKAENTSAAGSQIREADIAEESAKLLRTRILQQAGTAVLSQANQAPQLALKLLEGIA